MALTGIILLFISVVLFSAALPFGSLKNRFFSVILGFWLLVYVFTEIVGAINYTAKSFLAFSLIVAFTTVMWCIANGHLRQFSLRRMPVNGTSIPRLGLRSVGFCLLAIPIALLVLVSGIDATFFGPFRASDSFSYHIPTVNSWIAHGNTSIQANLDYRIGYWPHGLHSLYGLVLLLTESPRYIGIVNVFYGGLLWVVGLYFLLRQLQVSRLLAMLLVLFSMLNAVWFVQSKASSTDLVLAAIFALSLGLSVQFLRHTTLNHGYLLSVAMAFMASTKVTGMLFAVIMSVWILTVLLIRLKSNKITASFFVKLLTIAIPLVFIVGGMTYWRNLILFGNPVYPVALGPFAASPAAHLVDWYYQTSFWEVVTWLALEPVKFIGERPQAMSPLYHYLVWGLPVVILLAGISFLITKLRGNSLAKTFNLPVMPVLGVLGCLVLALICYRFTYINPLRMERYLYFGSIMIFVLWGCSLSLLPRWSSAAVVTVLLGMLAYFGEWDHKLLEKYTPKLASWEASKQRIEDVHAFEDQVNQVLGDRPVLVIKQKNPQLPFEYLSQPSRKTYVGMVYGPNWTDPDLNIVSSEEYDKIANFTGVVNKYSMRKMDVYQAAKVGKNFIEAFIERYCIVYLVSTIGAYPADLLPSGFEPVGRIKRNILYQNKSVCARLGNE